MVVNAVGGSRPRRFDREIGRLVGSRCAVCGGLSWPARAVCDRCGSPDLREVLLEQTGTLVSVTRVWVPRPGLPSPYSLGQVWLAGGLGVFAHVRAVPDEAKVPLPVHLVLPRHEDPSQIAFWFEPADPGRLTVRP